MLKKVHYVHLFYCLKKVVSQKSLSLRAQRGNLIAIITKLEIAALRSMPERAEQVRVILTKRVAVH